MTLDLALVIFTSLSNIGLGLFTYFKNRKSASHILLALLTAVITFWSITNYFSLHSNTPEETLFWIRAVMFITSFLGPIIFLLVYVFPNQNMKINKKLFIPILLFMFLSAFLALTPYMFKGVRFEVGNIRPEPGPAIVIFAINFMGLSVGGFILLIYKYFRAVDLEKLQIKFFLLGIVVTFSLVILIFLTIVIFKTSLLVSFGPLTTIILIGFISYAIVKHKLLNIKVLTTKVFVVIILLILLTKIFTFVSLEELIVNAVVFIIVAIFSYLLVKSVINEVQQKEMLGELNDKLKELDKQKDEFVSMAAHELRSPLTAIKGYVSMVIEGDTGDIPEKARQYLADSMAVTDRLVRLVNNMLNVSRIEEGRIVYQIEETSLIRAVQEVFNSSRVEAERKELEFKVKIPNGLEDNVKADPDRIREVIGNLVSNAIKFTEKGSVSISVTNPKPDLVKVEVVDTGPGISKEEQTKLFQKFYRAESTAGKTFGTGLGLYITKLLVEKFGGKMGLESELDKGSNFWFELPIAKKV